MLEFKNVTAGYGGKTALRIDSLSLPAGQITAVIGVNGSGKSTLLKTAVGIVPHRGEIRIDDTDVSALSCKARARRIAYLPQTLTAPDMDAYTLVSHGRYARLGRSKTLSAADRDSIEAAMRLTGTWEMRDKFLKRLSGGERQSVYLAMAIAQDTQMLLLDEPDTYLDVPHQLKIHTILRQLADDGKGIVTVSHDIAKSFSQSDRICILSQGKAAACDTPAVLSTDDRLYAALGVRVAKTNGNTLYDYALTL